MTSVEPLDAYFKSLNSLTKKIWNDKENVKISFGIGEDEWNSLTEDEQEDLYNRYLIDDEIRQKYASVKKKEIPQLFPMMKIYCGEIIAADNQNDDLITWQDEHSGPFSLMTRSQQDLTLDDFDIPTEQKKRDKHECSFRGKCAQPESLLDDMNELSMKFLNIKKEERQREEALAKETRPMEEIFSTNYENYFATDDDNQLLVDQPSSPLPGHSRDSFSSYLNSNDATQKISTSKKKSFKSKGPKTEAELHLIDEKLDNSSWAEQVSPVFVEDFRESISGDTAEGFLFPDITLQFDGLSALDEHSAVQDPVHSPPIENPDSDSVICLQPTSASVVDTADNQDTMMGKLPDDEPTTPKTKITSGFDFLDNW